MSALTEAYAEARAKWRDLLASDLPVFYVGAATCGRAAGAGEVLEHLRTELDRRHLKAVVIEVGCLGPCSLEPLVTVHKPGGPQVCYKNVGPGEMTGILDRTVMSSGTIHARNGRWDWLGPANSTASARSPNTPCFADKCGTSCATAV